MVFPVLRFVSVLVLAVAGAQTISITTAGPADVLAVKVQKNAPGVYRFDVTVTHADEGWKHYADAWEVIGPGGQILGTRVLGHPHESEQPFTRSLSGVKIPMEIGTVRLRARDKVHGFGGAEAVVALPR